MSKGRLITRSVTSTRPVDMTLNLDCIEDSLSEAQQMTRMKIKENYDKVVAKLDEMVKEHGAQKVCQAGLVSGYHYTLPGTKKTLMPMSHQQGIPLNVVSNNQQKNQAIKVNVMNNAQNSSGQGNIQLLMNPRILLGTVAPSGTQGVTTTTTASSIPTAQVSSVMNQPDNASRNRSVKNAGGTSTHVVATNKVSSAPQSGGTLRVKNVNKPPVQVHNTTIWPSEQTSTGGIAVGSKNAAADQIEESKKNLPDGREVTFNKLNGGRTFPSLVVVARTHLRTKDISSQVSQKERSDLDLRVKSVLMYSATKFAEWLIQRGLVRSEQYCPMHSTGSQKMKLKLGMYSDSSGTFPYSGGYVWISSCCPDRFVSVFNGSLFQGSPHVPSVILKLIYHWACQTNVQNVISWVKVSNVYVKNFYSNLRSVCTAAVHDKATMMGGKNSMIQVGVISLGTTSQDGNLRQVKVEVLGVLNPETSEIRLRACEPLYDGDRSFKRRFNNILYPLKEWVHKDSKIITDYTVDRSTLQEMGFTQVVQSAFSDQNPRNMKSNYHMMEYLRKIVPRMFQNTLSLLSRQMIQQFLDELVWREMFGATATRAFDNIILHIAEQTRIDSPDCLLDRLAKISANPFKDWSYSPRTSTGAIITTSVGTPIPQVLSQQGPRGIQTTIENSRRSVTSPIGSQFKPGPRRGKKRPTNSAPSPEPDIKRSNNIPETLKFEGQIHLEKFYYATMESDKSLLSKETKTCCAFKCFLCPAMMRCNTEVMAHMISHVPARVPDQQESPVCQYCCAAFSSKHQMVTHVSETHTKFGQSDGDAMVVCAICEQKFFGNDGALLVNHLGTMHCPSEMPYRCESCNYRTSSHKDVIDHFYKVHEKGEGLQCPYCLKVIQFIVDGRANSSNVHAYLLHMQRHIVRREQGRGNKCSRCCLWFNQRSSLKNHLEELHQTVTGPRVTPCSKVSTGIMISRHRLVNTKRNDIESPPPEFLEDEKFTKWNDGPISITVANENLSCQECEEDINEPDHYPGEQRCQQCRYVTCCWRAFKEHQRQIHNERPMTSLVVPSPLINIPLEKRMSCSCGKFSTDDGNSLANHLIKCERGSAYPSEEQQSGMLDSLGLVPKST
ncbi:uncharacterized protein row [Venturia canescens]|uniref:uncharacterized protein row n=1 Tax=Venturia canescens TaxID=32260 RepID=UPI001C9D5D21|nr:uncharacterized protein LOC122418451 [Venturia canescens]